MKLTRDSWLGIGILFALIVVTIITALQKSKSPEIPYLSTSSAPNGTLALKLWLNNLGYETTESSSTVFEPKTETKIIFILEPSINISDNEWKLLDNWIKQGGTLILAGDNLETETSLGHFDFSMEYMNNTASEFSVSSPILNSPLLTSKIITQANFGLTTSRSDFLPILSANGYPIVISFQESKGRVILSSTPYPFSNLALKNDGNASMILNLLALTAPKGAIWFDEWHHGFQTGNIIGPSQWLQHTPGGHAILFVVGVIFLALILQGRAFGRPVPLTHEIKRRGPLEHVTAIANLNRKAGHKNEVLKQYHQRVKRHLGQRYRIDPSMNDEEYVNTLSKYNSAIDKDALLSLLKRLSQKNISEAELLKLAAEASHWINE
ncbi:MAG: DUF4350 domain-containing protein [Anaerolineales bacterium]